MGCPLAIDTRKVTQKRERLREMACGVCGVVWHAENPVCRLKTPPCVHSKRPVYAGNTRTCFSTCARGAGTHGDVLNVHTESVLSLHTGVIASSAYQEKPTQSLFSLAPTGSPKKPLDLTHFKFENRSNTARSRFL